MKKGFSLVEISVVLIIIALVVAGIAAGGTLIKQAELKSVASDLSAYKAAYNSFIIAYNKPPGDISNATFFFPAADCEVTVDACNGDGDGLILAATDNTDEVRAAMKHLSLSGLLSKFISPVTINATTYIALGANAPKSRIDGAGYMLVNRNAGGALDAANALVPAFGASDNIVYLGGQKSVGAELLIKGAVIGYDAYNLDKKLDDGLSTDAGLVGSDTGSFRAINGDGQTGCIVGGYYEGKGSKVACLVGFKVN